jgi:hypothetical protein
MKEDKYVQFGCGFSSPKEWINFDYSPAILIQKFPVLGKFLKLFLKVTYPKNVKYGNIVKGLPLKKSSCKAIFSSHTLEHLSLEDFRKALKNTYALLQRGGVFRCIVPDLEQLARECLKSLNNEDRDASIVFLEKSLLGIKKEPSLYYS